MSVAKKLVAWLDTKPESWIDAQEGLGEIYAEAQVEAAEHSVEPTRCPHCATTDDNHPVWCPNNSY